VEDGRNRAWISCKARSSIFHTVLNDPFVPVGVQMGSYNLPVSVSVYYIETCLKYEFCTFRSFSFVINEVLCDKGIVCEKRV
jgi:hypothetical protein